MFKTILRILLIVLLVLGIFWLANTTWNQFKQDIDLKNPLEVFGITVPSLDTSSSTAGVPEIHAEEPTPNPNQTANSESTNKPDNTPGIVIDLPVIDNTSEPSNDSTDIPEVDTKVLKINKEQLNTLIKSIRVSSEKAPDGYIRDEYEKPTHSYKLNGEKFNRNKYAWHISAYLISEEPFKYTCPYTEIEITDMSKLDYEHIIPLSYIYKYGDTNWTDAEKNKYAYDMLIGMDVLNSANRSHSDKGPADWLPEKNISSYCLTWLIIAKEYDIALRRVDIDVCKLEILNDLENATFINQFLNTTEEYQLQQEWAKDILELKK